MKKMILVVFAFVLAGSGGCATLRGMADDFQNLGRGMKKALSDYQDENRRERRDSY